MVLYNAELPTPLDTRIQYTSNVSIPSKKLTINQSTTDRFCNYSTSEAKKINMLQNSVQKAQYAKIGINCLI